MTNKELYTRCLELSGMIKKYRNRFIALLPEVAARRLYLEHDMHSIYEFAAKLGCLSNKTVDRVLKVSEKLESKPILKSMFQSGEVGWSKLEIASRIQADEKEIAKILPTISKQALVLMAQENFAGEKLQETKEMFSVKIDSSLLAQLRVLKLQLEKENKQPLSWEQTLGVIVSKLQKPAFTNQLCTKCSKPAEHLHHQIPYSISKSHESIIPLCKAHHDLIHHTGNTVTNRKYQYYKSLAIRL